MASYSAIIAKFQSTLPHGERPALGSSSARPPGFDPRSRTGSDRRRPARCPERCWFQSTLPHGERPAPCPARSRSPTSFNPRSRTGSDSVERRHVYAMLEFQSTLPHGERPWAFPGHPAVWGVSIHAPARGATGQMVEAGRFARFQSTLPHGERQGIARPFVGIHRVSIHAPARGATEPRPALRHPRRRFNPRSRTGSDVRGLAGPHERIVSIHAPARGATGEILAQRPDHVLVSIHAPARGATRTWSRSARDTVFQSTLPHGERRGMELMWRTTLAVSIHAPARGAT